VAGAATGARASICIWACRCSTIARSSGGIATAIVRPPSTPPWPCQLATSGTIPR